MKRDKIYEDLQFTTKFSMEDWNALIKLKLRKYFLNDAIFEKNKEILRSEIINYIKFCNKLEYFTLFEWTYDLYIDCINIDKQKSVKIIAKSFDEVSNTDMRWMTNVLTQPNSANFAERDKIDYYFKIIDETLEGVFKRRFKLIDKLANFKLSQNVIDNSNFDFGKLMKDFPITFQPNAQLFLQDPFFSISTNQWRNIAAHKSFTITKENITIEYGRSNIQSRTISYGEFYKVVHWTQDIYRVIRLVQVFTELNYTKEIVAEIGGTANMNVRFESSLLHLIHNIEIVGFEFVSSEEQNDVFCLNVKGKLNHDLKSSLIHASQCLDQLSCAIYNDKFVRDNFQKTRINIVDDNRNMLASATIPIEVALEKVKGKLTVDEYLENMDFDLKNDT